MSSMDGGGRKDGENRRICVRERIDESRCLAMYCKTCLLSGTEQFIGLDFGPFRRSLLHKSRPCELYPLSLGQRGHMLNVESLLRLIHRRYKTAISALVNGKPAVCHAVSAVDHPLIAFVKKEQHVCCAMITLSARYRLRLHLREEDHIPNAWCVS